MARAMGRVPVAPNDGVWLQDSETNRMVIHGLYVTDHIDLAAARDVWRVRVLDVEGGDRYPRFRQRLVQVRAKWFWEADPLFDVTRHIVASPLTGHITTADLQAYIGTIAHQPLDDDRPRWRIEYIEDYEDGQSAFLVRMHHALADGISMVPVILSLMDELATAPDAAPSPTRPLVSRLTSAVLAPLAAPVALLRRVLWSPDRHALHGPRVSGRKKVAWTRAISLDVVKAVKNRYGATVNDVLMAVVSGAIARHLETADGARVPHIRVSMPVNMRGPDEPLHMENRFAAVPLTLSAFSRHLPERLAAVKRQMDTLKQSLDPLVIYGVVKVFLTTMPAGMSRRLIDFFANKCTCVITNVPGPQVALAFGGRALRSLMFWVPQRADIAVGVSILSFAGNVQVGVIADVGLLDDPERLVTAIEAEFDELQEHV
jgi:WS/DGAT/MGAT family acyltransferase